MTDRRLGKLVITREMMEDRFEQVKYIFRDLEFMPFDTQTCFYNDTIEYIGHSPKFKLVAKGSEVPNYPVRVFREVKTFGDITWIQSRLEVLDCD